MAYDLLVKVSTAVKSAEEEKLFEAEAQLRDLSSNIEQFLQI